ncbi:cytochrome c oxidase subunit II [Methylomicrobium album]|uniref:Cytochrome aa3 subunit 2 n=1 Tax=Methylomicrobium album BG8 TaxID=686340 RepID=H8GND9_METAL|nr:cytochrome c oxidase subunit II [Methylomicrobium album]EIC28368.1 cytochrome c oxidase, subunit II [Methylomicrobium album BG8]
MNAVSRRLPKLFLAIALITAVAGCSGEQSAFAGLGPVSSRITLLTWIMFAAAALITVFMCGLTALAIAGPAGWRRRLADEKSVMWGGVVFPVATLSVLLFYGFSILNAGERLAQTENPIHIAVVGEQWWWRVIYRHGDGRATESANEVRIPTGRPVEIELTTADVIHSFWLPAYAGKVDMIPGHVNRLHFVADQPGVVRGQCAEYCGGAHALMAFYAVAMAPADYDAWLAKERADAQPAARKTGERLFSASGCGGCHSVRGTSADGKVGPDLTHVGGRVSLGAGILPNTPDSFTQWIGRHQKLKPDNLMLPFDFFSESELRDLSAYLKGLE